MTIPELYAQPEPADIASEFAAYAASEGRSGPASQIRCAPFADGLELCFRYADQGHLRYVTQSEVVAWHADTQALLAAAKATAEARGLADTRFERTAIPDTDGGVYWVSRAGDGLDGAGLLDPQRLEKIAGGAVVVGVPASGILLFWRPGTADVDRIMAVGVRRMAEASDHPISTAIFRWDGLTWRVWGEAVPAAGQGSGSGSGAALPR